MSTPVVRRISAAETHSLRKAVLRNGSDTAVLVFEGDNEVDTFHLGAYVGDNLVGIGSFLSRPCPDAPGIVPSVQLRGMAVSTHLQSGGIGALLMRAAVEDVRAAGAAVLWANARDAALGFYRDRLGMSVSADGFIDTTTGLPHHRVWLHL